MLAASPAGHPICNEFWCRSWEGEHEVMRAGRLNTTLLSREPQGATLDICSSGLDCHHKKMITCIDR
jgi:hypothetical protein